LKSKSKQLLNGIQEATKFTALLVEVGDDACVECAKESVFLTWFVNSQERIPIEEVFQQLKCSREGLSSDEGANRLQIFGPNKLEEKKVPFITIHFG